MLFQVVKKVLVLLHDNSVYVSPQPFHPLIMDAAATYNAIAAFASALQHVTCHLTIFHPVITPDSTGQSISFNGTTEECQSCQYKVVVGAVEIPVWKSRQFLQQNKTSGVVRNMYMYLKVTFYNEGFADPQIWRQLINANLSRSYVCVMHLMRVFHNAISLPSQKLYLIVPVIKCHLNVHVYVCMYSVYSASCAIIVQAISLCFSPTHYNDTCNCVRGT